jgi:hypothetical protein
MYTAKVTRRDVLDIFQGSFNSQLQLDVDNAPDRDGDGSAYTMIWEGNDSNEALPSLIVIPHTEQQDFLAWAYTYLATMRPFTAFVRVVDPSMIHDVNKTHQLNLLGKFGEAFVALILGEALIHLEPRPDLRQLTSNACANTHGFAITRAFVLGFDRETELISRSWSVARELTRQPKGILAPDELKAPFDVLLRVANDSRSADRKNSSKEMDLIYSACRELASQGEILGDTWHRLTASIPGAEELLEQMSQSRENRLRAFEKLAQILSKQAESKNSFSAFICGYIGSRIAPGELDHFNLFARLTPFAPSSLLWFCLCAGLQSHGQTLAFVEGLGRRLLRDLEQYDTILSRPKCDVSLSELVVLLNRDKALSDFKTGSNGSLNIELIPCVTTTVRWSRTPDPQAELFEKRDSSNEVRVLFAELGSALERVEMIRRKLERTLDILPGTSRYASEKRPRRG